MRARSSRSVVSPKVRTFHLPVTLKEVWPSRPLPGSESISQETLDEKFLATPPAPLPAPGGGLRPAGLGRHRRSGPFPIGSISPIGPAGPAGAARLGGEERQEHPARARPPRPPEPGRR